MPNLLVINADGPETRVALIENGQVAEIYIERRRERGIVGNIYKGKVVRVLPGMQAAFVDAGLERTAFLHVDDIAAAHVLLDAQRVVAGDSPGTHAAGNGNGDGHPDIRRLVNAGDDIVVQVLPGREVLRVLRAGEVFQALHAAALWKYFAEFGLPE